MKVPTTRSPLRGRSWITAFIPILSIILLYRTIEQEISIMRSNPGKSFMAAMAASFARHGHAATVDLGWYAPNATAINNLSQAIGGSGVYGFIYNSSTTPAQEYGIYNWCNMPHVRATEYKKPSSEYKLQYVEVVSSTQPYLQLCANCTSADSSTSQTNGLRFELFPCRIIRLEL
jgi:hypothetical protein